MLAAVDQHATGITEVVVAGDRTDLVAGVQRRYLPNAVLAWGERYDSPLVERYAGSDAALAHLETFGERFAGRFLDATDPVRLTVMGSPSDTVKTTLSGFAPKFLQPFGGFVRDHGT